MSRFDILPEGDPLASTSGQVFCRQLQWPGGSYPEFQLSTSSPLGEPPNPFYWHG